MLEQILALGLALSTASNLRFSQAFPVGPGEILIVIYMFLKSSNVKLRNQSSFPFGLFVLTSFIVLQIGTMMALFLEKFQLANFIRTYSPLLFSFAFIYSFLRVDLASMKLIFIRTITYIVSINFFLLLYATFVSSRFLGLNLFLAGGEVSSVEQFQTYRFSGFSNNPNQLALSFAPIPFLIFYFKELGYFRFIIAGIVVLIGWLSGSDALYFGWFATVILFLCISIFQTLLQSRVSMSAILGKVLAPMFVLGLLFLYIAPRIGQAASSTYANGNQGSARVALWENGIRAWEASPIFGFGAGSFSGLDEPFTGSEAHNTFIDWLTNTGVAGISLYLFLIYFVFQKIRNSNGILLASFASLIAFSVFHFVLRQPLFWFYFLIIYHFADLKKTETPSVFALSQVNT